MTDSREQTAYIPQQNITRKDVTIPPEFEEIHFPEEYPITKEIPYARALFEDRDGNPTILLMGETGSGKTTALYEIVRKIDDEDGVTLVTQPTRVAATGAAKRMKELAPAGHGQHISHQIGGEKHGTRTRLTSLTEGMALGDILDDPLLTGVNRIIIDEAHSEEVDTWQIMGLALRAQELRKEQGLPTLQIVLCSATLNKDRMEAVTGDVPEIEAEGRTFPITPHFMTRDEKEKYMEYKKGEPVFNYVRAAVDKAFARLKESPDNHDILIFLPGMPDIEKAIQLAEEMVQQLDIPPHERPLLLPLAGTLSKEAQDLAVYEDTEEQKMMFSTNVAEASITPTRPVDVVLNPMVNTSYYDSATGFNELRTEMAPMRRLKQQMGRAGRMEPGHADILLTEDEFNNLIPKEQIPEIHRTNLASFVLSLRAAGLKNILDLRIPEHAAAEAYARAEADLVRFGALDAETKDITADGNRMARELASFSPEWARLILEAEKTNSVMEMVTIAAFCAGKSVWNRPMGMEEEAKRAHAQFKKNTSDFITYLDIWDTYMDVYEGAFEQTKRYLKTSGAYYRDPEGHCKKQASRAASHWAHENFLNERVLKEVDKLRRQVRGQLKTRPKNARTPDAVIAQTILQAMPWDIDVVSAHDNYGNGLYTHLETGMSRLKIHPGSALGFTAPDVVQGMSVFKNPHGIHYIQHAQVVPIEVLAAAHPKMIEQVTSQIVENSQFEELEARTYHIKSPTGTITIHKEFPLSAEQKLQLEIRSLAEKSAVYPFQMHNNQIMDEVVEIFKRQGRIITTAERTTMLSEWYAGRLSADMTIETLRETIQTGNTTAFEATRDDFIQGAMAQEVLQNNPDSITVAEVPISLTYQLIGEQVVAHAEITQEQALQLVEWPSIPSGKQISISVTDSSGTIIESANSLEQVQDVIRQRVKETAWTQWTSSHTRLSGVTWELAQQAQTQIFGTDVISYEPFAAYPVFTIDRTTGLVTTTYSQNRDESDESRQQVASVVQEIQGEMQERQQLQRVWEEVQAPEAGEYITFFKAKEGEESLETKFARIREHLAAGKDIRQVSSDILFVQKAIEDSRQYKNLLERIERQSQEPARDYAAEQRAQDEARRELTRKQIAETYSAQTGIRPIEDPDFIVPDDQLVDIWNKERNGLKKNSKQELQVMLLLKGPHYILQAEGLEDSLDQLITEYREKVRAVQDVTRKSQYKQIIVRMQVMHTMTNLMHDYGITSLENTAEFNRIMETIITPDTFTPDLTTAESNTLADQLFSQIVDNASFT